MGVRWPDRWRARSWRPGLHVVRKQGGIDMAVYTLLDDAEMRRLLAHYAIGAMRSAQPIAAGIENSTYLIQADSPGGASSEYVLTIAESHTLSDVTFIARLTGLLQQQGMPVPAPLPDRAGNSVALVRGKPAVLVPKIAGAHPHQPSRTQCREIGRALGQMHRITLATDLEHSGHRSIDWLTTTARAVRAGLLAADRALLDSALAQLERLTTAQPALPMAVIHGDLFRDNALFRGERLMAIIDFFSAGTGFPLFDLAVATNDWCFAADTEPTSAHLRQLALIEGYAEERSPGVDEQRLWPVFLRIAALRFWVSRLAEPRQSGSGGLTNNSLYKNPDEYRDILKNHTENPVPWPFPVL